MDFLEAFSRNGSDLLAAFWTSFGRIWEEKVWSLAAIKIKYLMTTHLDIRALLADGKKQPGVNFHEYAAVHAFDLHHREKSNLICKVGYCELTNVMENPSSMKSSSSSVTTGTATTSFSSSFGFSFFFFGDCGVFSPYHSFPVYSMS